MTPRQIIRAMNEGDVFRWSYKAGKLPSSDTTAAYWCRSRIATYQGGFLGDTYWGESDRRWVREDEVDLTFLGNLNDYEPLSSKGRHYYDPADILDLSHANDTRRKPLVRKGAQPSPAALIEYCKYQIEKEESAKRSAERQIEFLQKAIADIEAGKINEVWV